MDSNADGSFETPAESLGFYDVIAAHDAHGVAKKSGVLAEGQATLSFGDIMVVPRGIVAGKLLGYGGVPLAFQTLVLESLEDTEDGSWYQTVTAEDGSFRFACLGREAHTLSVEGIYWEDEEAPPTFTPDVLDIVLHLAAPSACITVEGPNGAALEDVTLFIEPVAETSAGWKYDRERDVTVGHSKQRPTVFHASFTAPGQYLLEATGRHAGETYVQQEHLEVSARHHEVRVRLGATKLLALPFVVLAPTGEPVHVSSAHFHEPSSGASRSLDTTSRGVVRLTPGTWTVSVAPWAHTFVMPFKQQVDVTPTMTELTLRAPAIGGILEIRIGRAVPNAVPAYGKAVDSAGQEVRFAVEATISPATVGPLAVGACVVEFDSGRASTSVTIKPGAVTQLTLNAD